MQGIPLVVDRATRALDAAAAGGAPPLARPPAHGHGRRSDALVEGARAQGPPLGLVRQLARERGREVERRAA
eukprot:CAMPEP_0182897558 /NCGR_PEP_ID=MMETSP0034_2-20130328/26961_1 /TAXON_ID=156128 /ORGANISM="Nephroselmis pyriformis, Strain CCMP717" /LENGTH=71 /DNA_ID=CAMNT_0025031485 /DNA_START=102 /DNA_END=314 /DNA_ORIENTATION=+